MSMPSAAEKRRESDAASRTALGAKRAPGRKLVPPSNGTPSSSTSTAAIASFGSSTGKRKKLGTPAKRGILADDVGTNRLRRELGCASRLPDLASLRARFF